MTFFLSLVYDNFNHGYLHIIGTLIIIKTFYKNNESPINTFRALREHFGIHNRPTTKVISKTVKHFEEKHTLLEPEHRPHPRNVRTPENIAAVSQHVQQAPNLSNRRRSQ